MKKAGIILLAVACVAALSLSSYVMYSSPKTAYIELPAVFENFEMKKELEKELQKISTLKQNQLDSLKFDLQQQGRASGITKKEMEEFEIMKHDYLLREEQTAQNLGLLSEEYNDRIWKQLNQYIADYGKDKGYTFLYGASGSGAVMYADEENNVTAELSAYVNNRYSGKTTGK